MDPLVEVVELEFKRIQSLLEQFIKSKQAKDKILEEALIRQEEIRQEEINSTASTKISQAYKTKLSLVKANKEIADALCEIS